MHEDMSRVTFKPGNQGVEAWHLSVSIICQVGAVEPWVRQTVGFVFVASHGSF